MFFLPKRLEKSQFFLNFGWNFNFISVDTLKTVVGCYRGYGVLVLCMPILDAL